MSVTSGPECVEGRAEAIFHFLVHLLLDLVQRHMAGTFDHDLHVILPRPRSQLTQGLQFGELRRIAGICDATRTQSIAEREAHIVLRHHLHDAIEILVQKVLLVVVGHPLRQDGATPADDAGDAAGHHGHILDEHPGMDGEVVDALLRLLLNHLEVYVDVQVFQPLHAVEGFVDRHCADRHRRVAQDGLADLRDIATGREVHDGVCAKADRGVKLGEFLIDIRRNGGVADVGIDLAS